MIDCASTTGTALNPEGEAKQFHMCFFVQGLSLVNFATSGFTLRPPPEW